MKIYLAGPFFNDEQLVVQAEIETYARQTGHVGFSPRLKCFCPPGASMEQRVEAFHMNCDGIMESDFILARIDDFDPGTVWEVGYAYGLRVSDPESVTPFSSLKPRIYCYTTVEGRGLNLMLAQSSDGFLQGLGAVEEFLKDMAEGRGDGRAKTWNKNII